MMCQNLAHPFMGEYEKLITENRKLKKSESIVYNTQKPNG